ncbi:MAG TPA: MFS transporter [Candidatus Acidoferrales bacterium]|nr:MFS transporter [Candidatus Acidoferrales bacterium]
MSRFGSLLLDVEPLRQDRDFRLIWTGQVISSIGRQVTVVTLPYQLFLATGSPLSIGALALVQLVPLLAFSLYGGAVADAVDRRKLLLVTQSALALSSAALVVLAITPHVPVVLIYVVAFIAATVSSVDQPARTSAIPRLVPRRRLTMAIALNQAGFQTAGVVGPAVGGLLIATVGPGGAYLVDVVTYGASLAALLVIAPIPPLQGVVRPGFAAMAEGLRFARSRPAILGTFIVDLDAMIFGMPQALFPVLALTVFHGGAEGYGLLAAAPAAGALIGALMTGWVSRVRMQGRAVYVAVAVWGLAITAFGLATFSLPLALVLLAVAGGADVVSAVFRATILQLATPDELRGRLSALHGMVVTAGPRVGDMEATAVATAVSAQFSVVTGGLACLVGLALIAWRLPELGRYDTRRERAAPFEQAAVPD